jgi:hypothetical protein
MTKPSVFISSSMEDLEAARELARQLDTVATVRVWSDGSFLTGETVYGPLIEIANRSDFAVFILPTDRQDMMWSSRSNQSFALGYFAGRLGISRMFVLAPERVNLPTDLLGMMYIPLPTAPTPDLKTAIAPAVAFIRKKINETETWHDQSSREYYSCFISYSWEDKDFARRLYDDLSDVGVPSWLDAKDIKLGDPWEEVIAKAIQAHDKLLLVLSQSSIRSQWVREEVRNGLRLERERHRTFIFPIRLDDAIFVSHGDPDIDRLKERQIGDFRRWHDKTAYRRAFSQLVRDLVMSASVESVERS